MKNNPTVLIYTLQKCSVHTVQPICYLRSFEIVHVRLWDIQHKTPENLRFHQLSRGKNIQ